MKETETIDTGSSWQRTLWIMAFVQCIMMMAFSSMGPFLALYIEQLGVHDLKQVSVWAGLIASANFIMSAIFSPIWGSVADRKGRKLMVLRSTLAISVFTCLMGLATAVWQLLIIRILQGVFSGYSASANALVATKIPEDRLGFALGWLASAGMIGSLLGPLVGGIMADLVQNYRVVFFLTSSFALLAFTITALFVKEGPMAAENARKKPTLVEQFKTIKELKSVRSMFLVLFLTQFSVMCIQPVLPLFMKELTNGSAYLGTVAGFAFAVTGLADLLASPFLGKRSDVLGYRKVLTICMTGAALFMLPQAFAPNIWVFIASRFGLGLFIGGIMPTANALVGRLTPKEQRGRVFGFTASATFLGSFAGPLIGGSGSALFGIRTMLVLVAILYLLNMLWIRFRVEEPTGGQKDAV
ncbi:MFS transporter [Brevibacillus fulvus]|uniref:DHA1 family multidrug resistance protein-like MFS transporter n=1 Tax=Brevibacillus fulvus TaxID=1125967 RepID=A0A939BPH4_9BACL|nr:MFS transporter [Brevibacillus fulvus]MBM7590475.1 DHA1 family multidrug resistance protein-like MFS transporter [Brevibacillus fulvus]